MRSLRLPLVGVVMLALLADQGAAVAAQSPASDQDVEWPQLTIRMPYGDDPKQIIYAYELEPRAAPRPAVIIFHGGGLVYGQPLQDAPWAEEIAEQGYVTFLAGYRLFWEFDGSNPWPAQLDDARRAMRWVRAHADEFGVDPERVCAIGHSAGGQLAGLLGTTEGPADADPDLAGIPSRADCVVNISGDSDLMDPDPDPDWTQMLNRLYGGSIEEVPEVWRAASVVHNVDEETVPFLVIHGNLDEMVPIEDSRKLVSALAAAGVEHDFTEVDTDHFDILELDELSGLIGAF
ncbi:MAG: alpha/beta hydrolase, partial [Chloroflexota bacterium]